MASQVCVCVCDSMCVGWYWLLVCNAFVCLIKFCKCLADGQMASNMQRQMRVSFMNDVNDTNDVVDLNEHADTLAAMLAAMLAHRCSMAVGIGINTQTSSIHTN